MGKSYQGLDRKNNKFSQRDLGRKLKEAEFQRTFSSDSPPKPKPKKKWRPHSEIDED